MSLKDKFVRKYMKQAKQLADDNTSCYSRQLGAVIVKVYPDGKSRQVAAGYNGPPRGTPHTDSWEYLNEFVWPQLTLAEAATALRRPLAQVKKDLECGGEFAHKYDGCKTCPRRLVGAGTGLRTELCSCRHAEVNAITNAGEDVWGCWLFGWHGVPCEPCAGTIINAGIKKVYLIEDHSYAHGCGTDYSFGSRWLLQQANVELVIHPPEFYLS